MIRVPGCPQSSMANVLWLTCAQPCSSHPKPPSACKLLLSVYMCVSGFSLSSCLSVCLSVSLTSFFCSSLSLSLSCAYRSVSPVFGSREKSDLQAVNLKPVKRWPTEMVFSQKRLYMCFKRNRKKNMTPSPPSVKNPTTKEKTSSLSLNQGIKNRRQERNVIAAFFFLLFLSFLTYSKFVLVFFFVPLLTYCTAMVKTDCTLKGTSVLVPMFTPFSLNE